MYDSKSLEYINSADYKTLEPKVKDLKSTLDDNTSKSTASRKLRYAEVDIEAEREAGRLQPDELYIPQHIIDTNIRREQSPYIQYITQSPRAVILEDKIDPAIDLSPLERDLTKKIRFPGWELSMFSCIDGFQANGYSVVELVQDMNVPGELSTESVQFGDFAIVSDTRDIQAVEMTARAYYFTKTRLMGLIGPTDDDFNTEQVTKVVEADGTKENLAETSDMKDKSLHKIFKNMFRINGVVHVAWSCPEVCDDWLRKPRPLFIGRRKLTPPPATPQFLGAPQPQQPMPNALPPSEQAYETQYPYFLFPYLVSENDTISQLKGRVFLDQDIQEAVSSLLSSTITKARRSSGLYFGQKENDPNSDILQQKNIFFKSGCMIPANVQEFQLSGPDPALFNAIQMLVSANQNETSQINFAVNNRKDSRKTAKEVETATQQSQQLSTTQVVLFSIALTQLYTCMCAVIKSRVICGLLKVNEQVRPQYDREFNVKPSGDTDVIERGQLVSQMMNSWAVIKDTPAGPVFFIDLLEKLFPASAAKYVKVLQDAQAQQASAQAQQQQQMQQMAMQMGQSIVDLSKHPEYFSEIGTIHALPAIQQGASKIEQVAATMQQPKQQ